MKSLGASDWLQIWDWGQGQSPLRQALMILATAYPQITPERLSQLPIGWRDAHLIALRGHTFGSQVQGAATCPQCSEALEFGLSLADITVMPPPDLHQDTGVYEFRHEGFWTRWRSPTSQDLLAIQSQPEATATQALLQRCLIEPQLGDAQIAATAVPEAIASQLLAAMAAADPQADVHLDLTCPACQHGWSAPFDIVTFFWKEIATQAQRLLQEIHLLASTYGWTESTVLALSPRRRQAYLEMILA